MSVEKSYIFFTYSRPDVQASDRWANTGIHDAFFESIEEARQAAILMREEIAASPGEEVPVVRIEKIVTQPMTLDSFLALLNGGVGAIVKHYEIVETIG